MKSGVHCQISGIAWAQVFVPEASSVPYGLGLCHHPEHLCMEQRDLGHCLMSLGGPAGDNEFHFLLPANPVLVFLDLCLREVGSGLAWLHFQEETAHAL